MKLSDISILSKLHVNLNEADKEQYHPCKMNPWSTNLFLMKLYVDAMFDKYVLPIVAVNSSSITGFAFLRRASNRCELGIVTWPNYRHKGIGEVLMSHLSSYAKKKNISIYLRVLQSNQRAKNLYFKAGFVITHDVYKTNEVGHEDKMRRYHDMELKQ